MALNTGGMFFTPFCLHCEHRGTNNVFVILGAILSRTVVCEGAKPHLKDDKIPPGSIGATVFVSCFIDCQAYW